MPYDRFKHHRRSIRLKGYDYAQNGVYYITICTWDRECLFGTIVNGKMVLNEFGRIVCEEWQSTPEKRSNVNLDVFVVMPNHLHGILMITENRGRMANNGGNILQRMNASQCGGVLRGRGVLQYAPTRNETAPNEYDTGIDNRMDIIPTQVDSCGLSPEMNAVPLRSPSQTIGAIIRGFKGAATKRVNESRRTPGSPVWQRNYYERVVRDQYEFDRIRQYIINNPANWNKDIEHPTGTRATNRIPDDVCKEV